LKYLLLPNKKAFIVCNKGFRIYYGPAGRGGAGGGEMCLGAQLVHNMPSIAVSNSMLVSFFFITVVFL